MSVKLTSLLDSKNSHTRKPTGKRRREILDAALKCFLQKGVSDTTIRDIQAESGASSGSIYHLFSGKDEIALTLFVEGMTAYHAKLVRALKEQPTGHGCICAIIMAHIESVTDNPPLSSYLTQMGTSDDLGEISDQYQALSDGFAEAVWYHLGPYVERGEIVRLAKELYFPLIIGPTAFLSRSWLREQNDLDLMASAEDLITAAWKSLQSCD